MATVWAAGTHIVLGAFEPAAALDLIEGERVTATLGVPTMLAALAEEQERKPRDVASLVHLSHGPGGRPQPRGEPGELLVRGPNVMRGYWNKPAESAAALVDGWYRTGDVGYQDERGHVFLVDRSKDMIVTGGENVYSTEVEEVLFRHPAVREAAVFGIPDDRWGEAVVAVVHLRSPVEVDDLLEHCRRSIAAYKVP